MSCHCYSKWTYGDPLDEAPVKSIAGAVKHHGLNTPPVFGVFTTGDQFIFNIGILLSKTRGVPLTQELVETFVPECEHRADAIEIIVRVLKELEVFEKVLPVLERVEFKLPDKLPIPKVNKPWPSLNAIFKRTDGDQLE